MKSCRYGHTGGRFPSGDCRECTRARAKAWRAANPERYAAQSAKSNARRRERREAELRAAERRSAPQVRLFVHARMMWRWLIGGTP